MLLVGGCVGSNEKGSKLFMLFDDGTLGTVEETIGGETTGAGPPNMSSSASASDLDVWAGLAVVVGGEVVKLRPSKSIDWLLGNVACCGFIQTKLFY